MTDSKYISPNETLGKTDNESISLAIAKAKETGVNKVVIPKHNDRTDSDIWVIEDTVYLPSDIEIVIDNAHLRLADGVYCQIFANSSVLCNEERTFENEQYNIRICGKGKAVLDGGNYNGLSERTSGKDGLPHIIKNTTILFVNCRNITVENISVINQRYWGMTNVFVRESVFRNIYIESNWSRFADGVHYPDELPRNYDEIYVKNADGIDLRVGCRDILIENISGFAEDDMIALTALGGFEKRLGYYVTGKATDICNVKIRNISGDSACSLVRLLCNSGNKMHDIEIDGVSSVEFPDHASAGKMPILVRVSDRRDRYVNSTPMEKGDMKNITVRNLVSDAQYALTLYNDLENITAENITAVSGNAIGCNTGDARLYGFRCRNVRCLGDGEELCGDITVESFAE